MSYGELISGGTNVLDYAVAVPTHLGTSPVSRITRNFSFLQVVPEPVLEKIWYRNWYKKNLVPKISTRTEKIGSENKYQNRCLKKFGTENKYGYQKNSGTVTL